MKPNFSRLVILLLMAISLTLFSGCKVTSDDSTNDTTPIDEPTPSMPYTDGDGVAEITGVPSYSQTSIQASDSMSFSVTVPVDSDTKLCAVVVGYANITQSADSTTIAFYHKGTGDASADSGQCSVPIAFSDGSWTEPDTEYYARISVCSDDSVTCYDNNTWFIYGNDPLSPGTYRKYVNSTDTRTSTEVSIPYFEVTAP